MNTDFWKACGIRAVKTIAQTAVAMISTATLVSEVNWMQVASASLLAGILSVLTSIATGLPEVDLQAKLNARKKTEADETTE